MKKTLALILTLTSLAGCFSPSDERAYNNELEGILYLNEGAKGGPFLQVKDTPYFLDKEQLELALPGYKDMNEKLFIIKGNTYTHTCESYEQCLMDGVIRRFETIERVEPSKSEI